MLGFTENALELHLVVNRSLDGTIYFKYLKIDRVVSLSRASGSLDDSGIMGEFENIPIDPSTANTIESLFKKIELSKLENLKNELSADGSAWALAAKLEGGETVDFVVYNPSLARETSESKKLYLLGSYLWNVTRTKGTLY